jgi:HAD superfamily hydrolase (TIGR01509 family)
MPSFIAPRAAVFDVEGTLVDCRTLVLESWRETLQQAGHSVTHRDLQPFFGMDGHWMLNELLPGETADTRERLVKAQGECYRRQFLRRAPAFPGVRDLIETLKSAGVLIGIATTCQREDLARYDEQMGILELTDAGTCGEAVQHGKPDPALLQHCLRALNITDPADALAIGDTPYDAIAAKKIGMPSAGVLTGGFSEPVLRDAGCQHVFTDVRNVGRLWQDVSRVAR